MNFVEHMRRYWPRSATARLSRRLERRLCQLAHVRGRVLFWRGLYQNNRVAIVELGCENHRLITEVEALRRLLDQ